MKFGHNLSRNQVPEWASSYIDYKRLKKLIKFAALDAQEGGTVDLAEFSFTLDRNVENVDDFYNKKYGEYDRRLRLLHERYGDQSTSQDGMDKDEMDDLMASLLELRGQLRKLKWFGEVNRRGFIKITKKLDKKIPGSATQQSYLTTKVDPKAFATNHTLSEDMREVNDWLSSLADVIVSDDASSVRSAASTRIGSSKAALILPAKLVTSVDQAIRTDDSDALARLLLEANTGDEKVDISSPPFQKLLLSLLQRAISCRSKQCISQLMHQVKSIEDVDDIDHRNSIHRLVISLGRSKNIERNYTQSGTQRQEPRPFLIPAELPIRTSMNRAKSESERVPQIGGKDDGAQLLNYLLDSMNEAQRSALNAKDIYGRTPLHYSAEYGVSQICETVMKRLKAWDLLQDSQPIDHESWEDLEGLTPLHLSVMNGHPRTTQTLLSSLDEASDLDEPKRNRKHTSTKSSSLLSLAAKANSSHILRMLVEAGFDINQQDSNGEIPLHLIARFGYVASAEVLLDKSLGQSPNIDVPENTFAWTPIFVACVDGHLPIVKLLLAAGADSDRADSSGWTAKEHAALRGHLEIVNCLAKETRPARSNVQDTYPRDVSPPTIGSLEERSSRASKANPPLRTLKPIKTFGHRYLKNETMILVSLGSMDNRKLVDPVKLDPIPSANAHSTQLDTALSVVISAIGATGEPVIIDLPAQDNVNTEPFYFTTSDLSRVKLLFDLVPTYAGSDKHIIGRGIAILSSMKPAMGKKKMSLQGDVSVAIAAADTLEPIGSVNFNFLMITPFEHPKMLISEENTYWKETTPIVIGHRGMGKNFGAGRRSLELGENTIQSFIQAASLGATYVEFDVQLTKDHVPVIYHDFLVSETGIDAPVHTLTLEQFLHVSDTHAPHSSRPVSPHAPPTNSDKSSTEAGRRPRALSVGNSDGAHAQITALERMKYTRDVKAKGWKANLYGNVIRQPFTTLSEMFDKLDPSIGFNIEMKYPMLLESEDHDMDMYAVELNSFVDTVLQLVYDKMGERKIIFSSFHPDICLLLSFKQPSIPVLFLTDAGDAPVSDVRAQSLQEAIRFATRWNILGIVAAAEPFVMCPRLVKVVKESGLVCVSYGTLNNNPENVKLQVNQGIDAVIVDRVAAFREGLTS